MSWFTYYKNKTPNSSSHLILLTINLLHLKNELQLPPAITIWTQKNGSWKHYISLIIFQPKPLSDICSSCQKSSSQKEESISFQFSILSCTLGWIFQKKIMCILFGCYTWTCSFSGCERCNFFVYLLNTYW